MKSNISNIVDGPFCTLVIIKKINNTQVKYYDLFLFIPSFIFFVFLLFFCRKVKRGILSNNCSIITTLYMLLCLACGLKILRSVIGMNFNSTRNPYDFIFNLDKVLWLVVRFFLLSIEMSIITFGVATARLDSRAGIRRVLLITSLISFTYTGIQAILEFTHPDFRYHTKSNNATIYGHGGSLFSFSSSLLFFLIYGFILIMPYTAISRLIRLPTKKIFYIYCGILAMVYMTEAIGSLLFFLNVVSGLCVLDFTTFIYFAFYDPLVYTTFLHAYFRNRRILTFKHDDYVTEYPPTSVDDIKSYSSNTASNNYIIQADMSLYLNTDQRDAEHDDKDISNDDYFEPDQYRIINRDANIAQLMNEYYIMPEGACMDYTGRPPSSTMGSETTNVECKSNITSLSYENDPRVRNSWNMDDFVSK